MLGRLTTTVYFCREKKTTDADGNVSVVLLRDYKQKASITAKSERVLIGARYNEIEVLEVETRTIDAILKRAENYYMLLDGNVYSILSKEVRYQSSINPRYMKLRLVYERTNTD